MDEYCDSSADAGADVDSVVKHSNDDMTTQAWSDQKKAEFRDVHRSIFSGEGVALCLFGDDFRILNCNITFAKITGYDKSELLQMYWYDLIEEDVEELMSTAKQNEYNPDHSVSEFKCTILTKQGESRFVHVNLIRRPAASGILVSVFDMTELKRKEKNLLRTKRISQALMNSPTVATAIIKTDGTLVDLNGVTASRFKMSVEEMRGKNIWNFLPEDIKLTRQKKVAEAFERGCSVRFTDCRGGIYNDNVITPIQEDYFDEPLVLISASDITQYVLSKHQKDILLDSMTELFCFYDLDLKILWANRAAAKSLGLSNKEIIGRHCYELWNQDDVPCTDCPLLKAKESGKKEKVERKTPDGRYWQLFGYPVFNENGELFGLIELGVDISKRKIAEQQDFELKQNLELISDYTIDLELWIDVNGNLIWCNKAIEDFTGFSKQKACSMSPNQFIIEDQREFFNQLLQKSLDERLSFQNIDLTLVKKNNETCQISASWQPIYGYDKQWKGIRASFRDVTEKKRIQSLLDQSNKKLIQILGAMDELIYISDLRTYDLLYVNDAGKKFWGEDFEGKKCYEYLQDRSAPCPFCTNHIITNNVGESYIWEFQNEITNHWYRCIDRAIEWIDGRQVRFELAIDINDKKIIENQIRESEEKFRQIAENIEQVLYLYDPNNDEFLFVSPSYEKVWEMPVEEVMKDSLAFARVVHPDDREAFDEACRGEHEEGKYFNLKYRIVMPDGRVKWIWSRNFPVLGKQRTVGISEDITLLTETQKKYRTYIDSAPDGVVVVDENGKYLEINEAMCKITGRSKEELLSMSIQDTAVDEGKELAYNHFDKLKKEGSSFGESIFLHHDGSKRWWNIDAVKLSENRYLGFIQDITDRKRFEAEIEQKNKELSRINQLKSNFLNVTSHELRTPMTAMSGYLQMMKNNLLGEVTDDQQEAIDIILRNANRLDSLVDDILDTSRLESGTMKFLPQKTMVDQVLDEIKKTMRSEAEAKQITIEIEVSPGLPILTIDPDRIKQVIINLVKNAIKFSSEQSTITIQVKDGGECVIFSVIDEGRGIPKEKIDHVFDVFYQVESGIDRSYGGTGLGLTICKGIVIGHGGKIWVESVEGEGSIFSFSLPKVPVSDVEGNFQKIDLFNLN